MSVNETEVTATSDEQRLHELGYAQEWWFKGPEVQGTAQELAAIERDLAGTDA